MEKLVLMQCMVTEERKKEVVKKTLFISKKIDTMFSQEASVSEIFYYISSESFNSSTLYYKSGR